MSLIAIFYSVDKKLVNKLSFVQNSNEKEDLLSQSYETLDVQKSWDAMAYILTNQKAPNNHILSTLFYPKHSTIFIEKEKIEKFVEGNLTLLDEELINEVDQYHRLGVGLITNSELKKINDFLLELDLRKIFAEFNFDSLKDNKVYPRNGSKDDSGKLLKRIELLCLMVKKAYELGNSLLVKID